MSKIKVPEQDLKKIGSKNFWTRTEIVGSNNEVGGIYYKTGLLSIEKER
jgi:hypothetical protein